MRILLHSSLTKVEIGIPKLDNLPHASYNFRITSGRLVFAIQSLAGAPQV